MNKINRIAMSLLMALVMAGASFSASAQSALGDALGNMLQGVFSKSNLTVYDICGQWTSGGSAVSFQSENLLQKAGGMAAAGVIENKINPYFEKLGLDNAVLTIEADSTFTLKTKKFNLNGSLTSNGDGTFDFKFKALGMSLGSVKTYVQKSGNSMDVMFDAKKLKSLTSGIAKLTGISIAKTAAEVLDKYDGLCVGFKMNKTGDVEMPEGTTNSGGIGGLLQGVLGGGKSNSSSASDSTSTTESSSSSSSSSGLGGLLQGVLGGGKSSSSETEATQQESESGSKSSGLGGLLQNVLGGGNSGSSSESTTTESQEETTPQKYTTIGGGMLKGNK